MLNLSYTTSEISIVAFCVNVSFYSAGPTLVSAPGRLMLKQTFFKLYQPRKAPVSWPADPPLSPALGL